MRNRRCLGETVLLTARSAGRRQAIVETDMRIGIDASNLKSGGGLTHLAALLEHVDAREAGLKQVTVWGSRGTLDRLAPRPWLVTASGAALDGSAASVLAWRKETLPHLAQTNCDLLFAPGGLCTNGFHPVVTMSRNMLPFQLTEGLRYGPSRMLGRLALLRALQKRSFRAADGVIFLSEFAAKTVLGTTGPLAGKTAIIPHGVASPFFNSPRPQRPLSAFSAAKPLRILYTSIVDVYKHQWHVAKAVAQLRREGFPISIEFVGDAYAPAASRLDRTIRKLDRRGEFLKRTGPVGHSNLPALYHAADAFVFASSCENLPNILLEAMAAGLPIACSRRGPMPEVLGDGGLYFDPLRPREIFGVLRELCTATDVRERISARAHDRSQSFSWARCAQKTFEFLSDVLRMHRNRRSPTKENAATLRSAA
jgi:glycosyltransferase involved in cell wall biosynthesis